MSLFSGLQMLSIACSVVKMKLVALWLGTLGVGLFGIYQSVIDTVSTFTDMGLRQSSVRDIASEAGNTSRLAAVVRTVRRWSVYTGLFGAIAMASLAVPLGLWFFGDIHGCWGFMLLSVAMFLNAISGGEQALLQGAQKLRELARANLWATLGGLVLSVPLFYLCGTWGVVLSIITYAVTLIVAVGMVRLRPAMPRQAEEVHRRVPEFVKLGLYLAAAAFITSLAHTLFIGLLNAMTSTSEVGLVQAGDTLMVRYIGLLFTAIGMEFYPRLAANRHSPKRVRVFVNHEITLLLLCLTPLLSLFMLLREPIITLLYSREFAAIIPFVSWAALSSIPKAVSWCMAFTIVTKGDGRIFVLTEGLDALISVPLCLAAYTYYGMAGLGIAYIIWYITYCLLVGTVYYRRYKLSLSTGCLRLSALTLAAGTLILLSADYMPLWVTAALSAAASLPCLISLRRLMR